MSLQSAAPETRTHPVLVSHMGPADLEEQLRRDAVGGSYGAQQEHPVEVVLRLQRIDAVR